MIPSRKRGNRKPAALATVAMPSLMKRTNVGCHRPLFSNIVCLFFALLCLGFIPRVGRVHTRVFSLVKSLLGRQCRQWRLWLRRRSFGRLRPHGSDGWLRYFWRFTLPWRHWPRLRHERRARLRHERPARRRSRRRSWHEGRARKVWRRTRRRSWRDELLQSMYDGKGT